MDPRPAMVVLVAWNNFFKTHPDTVDEHFGPKFLEMTKKYASRFKNGTSCIS